MLARHSAEQIAKNQFAQGLTGAFAIGSGSMDATQIAQVAGQMLMMSYGRNDELEADGLGLRLMSEAGYDPRAMIRVMQILERRLWRVAHARIPELAPESSTSHRGDQRQLAKAFPNGDSARPQAPMHFLRDFFAAFNTFGVAASARQFAVVSSELDLMRWCAAQAGATPPFILAAAAIRCSPETSSRFALRCSRVILTKSNTVLVEVMAGESAGIAFPVDVGTRGCRASKICRSSRVCRRRASAEHRRLYGAGNGLAFDSVMAIDTTSGEPQEFRPRRLPLQLSRQRLQAPICGTGRRRRQPS